jgi:hypothetical protein
MIGSRFAPGHRILGGAGAPRLIDAELEARDRYPVVEGNRDREVHARTLANAATRRICHSTIGKHELGAERDKRADERAAHPSQPARTGDDVVA